MEEFEIKGIYFKSLMDNSTHYIIEACKTKHEGNVITKVYVIDNWPDNFVNNAEATELTFSTELVCEINMWGKYFFPVFKNDMQLYYDDAVYYDKKSKSDQIFSLMEAVNKAIEYGFKISGIKPY